MRILITGENGYISNYLASYLKYKNKNFEIVKKSIRIESIDDYDLTNFDILIHPAAIVHKKESMLSESIYFQVNTRLTELLALKAKSSGVKQFIFFSTMAVYGNVEGEINHNTINMPTSLYGKSKLAAEKILSTLQSDDFHVAIVRPPMVYGPQCPGNYQLLSKLSRITPIFPNIENTRSMIFINNLTEFINQIIYNSEVGIFHPQDKYFVKTTEMVNEIASYHQKRIIFNSLLGKVLNGILGNKTIYKKVFGDLYYAKELSTYKDNSYQKCNLKEAISISEKE
ncbi:NAD-dependent epimerase/dehydratase family protein [Solibacillus sp. NPDC093137]|uniref:NAD-dependent epimerase/dehydratase family protein n=1 Tax=Solibacillus sp. NPDC093137 TaxID=3390678 RepID=UPI003D0332B8